MPERAVVDCVKLRGEGPLVEWHESWELMCGAIRVVIG